MEPDSLVTSNHVLISNLQMEEQLPTRNPERKKKGHKRKSSCGSETNPIDLTEDEITPSKEWKKKKSSVVKDKTGDVTITLTKKELKTLKGWLKSCEDAKTTLTGNDPTNALGPSLQTIENTLKMIETRLCKIENTLEEMQKREKEAQCRVQKIESRQKKVKMIFDLESGTQIKQPDILGEQPEVGAQEVTQSQLNPSICETNTKEVVKRSQSMDIMNVSLSDKNVHNSVFNGECGPSTFRTFPEPRKQPEETLPDGRVPISSTANPTPPPECHNSSNNNRCYIEETFPGENIQDCDVANHTTPRTKSHSSSNQTSQVQIKEEQLELLPMLTSVKQEVDFMKDDDGRILLFVCSLVKKLNSVQHMAVAGTFLADKWTHEYPFVHSYKSAQDLKKMAELKAITFGLEVIKSLYTDEGQVQLCVMVVSSCRQLVQLMRKRNDFYPYLNLCDCMPLKCDHVPNKRWDTRVEFAAAFPEDMPNLILALKDVQVHWCCLENSSEAEQATMQKYRNHVENILSEEVKKCK